MSRLSLVVSFVCLTGIVGWSTSASVAQQTGPVLTGKVTAGQESLGGVLVSARKDGSTITVTVVSDKDGNYSFPGSRLEPGAYSLRIRAAGYDLDPAAHVSIASDKAATADLSLRPTKDLAAQLTNAEWLASMPGTDAQKGQLLNCVGCHTLSRPLNSNTPRTNS